MNLHVARPEASPIRMAAKEDQTWNCYNIVGHGFGGVVYAIAIGDACPKCGRTKK